MQLDRAGRQYRPLLSRRLSIRDRQDQCRGRRQGRQRSDKLALKLYDNQSDVNLSVRQYTQLVSQDKVDFLLGPFASNFALADSAVSEKYQMPMVQGGGASDQIFSRDFKYIFGTLAPASNYFGSTVEADGQAQSRAEIRRAALCRRCFRRFGGEGHAAC